MPCKVCGYAYELQEPSYAFALDSMGAGWAAYTMPKNRQKVQAWLEDMEARGFVFQHAVIVNPDNTLVWLRGHSGRFMQKPEELTLDDFCNLPK